MGCVKGLCYLLTQIALFVTHVCGSSFKQDRFQIGFKIVERTGLYAGVFVFMVVKKDVNVVTSFKAQTTEN